MHKNKFTNTFDNTYLQKLEIIRNRASENYGKKKKRN